MIQNPIDNRTLFLKKGRKKDTATNFITSYDNIERYVLFRVINATRANYFDVFHRKNQIQRTKTKWITTTMTIFKKESNCLTKLFMPINTIVNAINSKMSIRISTKSQLIRKGASSLRSYIFLQKKMYTTS